MSRHSHCPWHNILTHWVSQLTCLHFRTPSEEVALEDPGSSWCLVSAILRIWGPKFVKSMYLFCGFEGPNFEILSTFMQIWGLIGQCAADNTNTRCLHDLAISTEPNGASWNSKKIQNNIVYKGPGKLLMFDVHDFADLRPKIRQIYVPFWWIWGPKFWNSVLFMRIWGLIGQRAADNTNARRLHDLAISTELHFTCSLDNYKYHLLAASHWNAFQLTKSVISKAPPLKIRIPGRRIAQKAY